MRHKHICSDCKTVLQQQCDSAECILEPVEDVVYEQCTRCKRKPVRYADENPRWED